MYIPKRYGQSRQDGCPFCGKLSTTTNSQKIPVCSTHKNSILGDMKCACGEYLDLKNGKFGAFFTCMNCGCISMNKALEFNDVKDISIEEEEEKVDSNEKKSAQKDFVKRFASKVSTDRSQTKGKETIVRSDDPMYFD